MRKTSLQVKFILQSIAWVMLFFFSNQLLANSSHVIKKAQELVLLKQRSEAIQLLSDELQQKKLNSADKKN